jgi:TFIIH basal transcription factor complex TTD-A subunit
MPPKKKTVATKAAGPASQKNSKDLPPTAGYLISCDVPTKQYILYLNELKPVDKKFVLEDLDATHLLVRKKARDEIERKVEAWMDENVFSGKRGRLDLILCDCLGTMLILPCGSQPSKGLARISTLHDFMALLFYRRAFH